MKYNWKDDIKPLVGVTLFLYFIECALLLNKGVSAANDYFMVFRDITWKMSLIMFIRISYKLMIQRFR